MKKLATLTALSLLLIGCEDNEGQDYVAALEIAQCGITGIEIDDNSIVIRESDETAQWSAEAVTTFEQPDDCDFEISWSSDSEDVATVSSTGLIGTLNAGQANISASIGRFRTTTAFTVSDAAIQSISLDPAIISLNECTSENVIATGIYDDGTSRNISDLGRLTWSTDDESLASIPDISASGITLATHASGAGILTASHSAGVDATANLSILQTLSSITLSNTVFSLEEGESETITATGNFSDSTNVDISQNSEWTLAEAQQASFVTLSNSFGTRGNVIAVTAGVAVATAECGGLSAETVINVTEVPVLSSLSFTTTADPLFLTTDDTDEVLVLNATYSDGSVEDVSEEAEWEVITGDDDFIGVDDSSGDRGEIILSSDIEDITENKSVIIRATFEDTTAQIEVIVVPD